MGVDTNDLRARARSHELASLTGKSSSARLLFTAADELDALRAEVGRAASVLSSIADELGPMGDGDPCPVCRTYSHKGWCWFPALVEWDRRQAASVATSKEAPCKQ